MRGSIWRFGTNGLGGLLYMVWRRGVDDEIEHVTVSPDGRYPLHAGRNRYIWVLRTADILNPDIGHDSLPIVHKAEATERGSKQ